MSRQIALGAIKSAQQNLAAAQRSNSMADRAHFGSLATIGLLSALLMEVVELREELTGRDDA